MKIGYARVSTGEQNLSLQLDALTVAGCDPIFQESASSSKADRKGLADALAACSAGDVLTVWQLDRLGRSLSEVVGIADDLRRRGVNLNVLAGQLAGVDTSSAQGAFFFHIIAAFSQLERGMLQERTKAGMAAAKRRGKHVGRPRLLSVDRLDLAAKLRTEGKSWRQVSEALGVAEMTLRDSLKRRATELQARIERGGKTPLETYIAAASADSQVKQGTAGNDL